MIDNDGSVNRLTGPFRGGCRGRQHPYDLQQPSRESRGWSLAPAPPDGAACSPGRADSSPRLAPYLLKTLRHDMNAKTRTTLAASIMVLAVKTVGPTQHASTGTCNIIYKSGVAHAMSRCGPQSAVPSHSFRSPGEQHLRAPPAASQSVRLASRQSIRNTRR